MRLKSTPARYPPPNFFYRHELAAFAKYLKKMIANQMNPYWDQNQEQWNYRHWLPGNVVIDCCPCCTDSITRTQLIQLGRYLEIVCRYDLPSHVLTNRGIRVSAYMQTLSTRAHVAIISFCASRQLGGANHYEMMLNLHFLRVRTYYHCHGLHPDLAKIPLNHISVAFRNYKFRRDNRKRWVRIKAARNEGMVRLAGLLLPKMKRGSSTGPPPIRRQAAGPLIIVPTDDMIRGIGCCPTPSNLYRSMESFTCVNCGYNAIFLWQENRYIQLEIVD